MENSTSPAEAHAGHSVKAQMLYVKRNSSGAIPSQADLYAKDPDFLDPDTVDVHDVRQSDQEFSLATTGFQYERMVAPPDVDYSDDKSVTEKYLPALEEFVAQKLGASTVKAYHHKVRNQPYGGAFSLDYSGPAIIPHVDVTPTFAPLLAAGVQPARHRAAAAAADDDDDGGRWCLLNAWRPLRTVRRDPLAVADGASVGAGDHLVVPQPERGPDVHSWFLRRRAGHRWWYMAAQAPEDLLLFLQHDSAGAPPVPHAAISLPGAAPRDGPRESIEVRMVVYF